MDPLFVDPTYGFYNLLWNSPCIDTGDPNSPLDPDSTTADIGAFYFDQSINHPPTIVNFSPTQLDTIDLNSTIEFSIEAVDPEQDSLLYSWQLNGMNVGNQAGLTYAFSEAGNFEMWAYASDGNQADSVGWEITVLGLGVIPPQKAPSDFSVTGVYPNPFNPTTTIRFGLPEAGYVKVEVFDVQGRLVSGLGMGRHGDLPLQAGYHEVTFDGSKLASGVYIYRISAGEFSKCGKMILVR